MPIRSVLDRVLDNATKTKILRVLCGRNIGWTGRKMASELKVSPTTANKFLKQLTEDGVIIGKSAGKAHLYFIDPDNYTIKSILKPFFEKEKNVYSDVLSLIKRSLSKCGAKIRSAAIFGSVAKKEEKHGSDIDLVVIIEDLNGKKDVERSLDDIAKVVAQRFQTVISPYIVTDSQFRRKYMAKDALITEILRSYVPVYGEPLERIVI